MFQINMLRAFLLSLSLMAILGSPGRHAVAQSGANATPAPIVSLLRQNPVLAEVNNVDAGDLARIVDRLSRLANGPRPPRTRNGDDSVPPTLEELRQIGANPLFTAAYQQQPDSALETLRETNHLIQAGR
jgi:hypothetical protein